MHDCFESREDYTPSGQASGKWISLQTSQEARRLLRGWRCSPVIEALPEQNSAWMTCQMCERERVRYVHEMTRLDSAEERLVARYFNGETRALVGCICAGWMTGYFDQLGGLDYFDSLDGDARSALREQRKRDCYCWEKRAQVGRAKNDFLKGAGLQLPERSVSLRARAREDEEDLLTGVLEEEQQMRAERRGFISKRVRRYSRGDVIPEVDSSRTIEHQRKNARTVALAELRNAHAQRQRLKRLKSSERQRPASQNSADEA